MIELLIATIGLLLLALGYLLYQYLNLKSHINELFSKIKSENRARHQIAISLDRNKQLNEIAQEFNEILEKLQNAGVDKTQIERLKKENDKLLNSVAKFESDLTEISFFSKIGKKLTSVLDVESIAKTLFEYIDSLSNIEAIELIYELNNNWQGLVLKNDGQMQRLNSIALKDYTLYQWSIKNNANANLINVPNNYKSYVNSYPKAISIQQPKAILSIPLSLDNKVMGVLGVVASEADKLTNYQVEFIQSISTYLVVAIENSRIHELVDVERKKADGLLLNILPENVANDLKNQGFFEPKEYKNASILFTDFVGFTELSSSLSPAKLITELNHVFKAFDRICLAHGLEKIKTIGDAYMAAIGIKEQNQSIEKMASYNANNMVTAALKMQEFTEQRYRDRVNEGLPALRMRCGINTGTVVAGIVGETKFQYDIWGDAVNTASRMESNGVVGKVNITEATYLLLKDNNNLNFEPRSEIEIKGKGKMKMWLTG